ncbi:MAG TPA: hypothetical protein VMG12_05055 [Polyangiaceae bacterium]|nr:hypothetical protein [Polyangiaceae bacterium]
MVFPQDESEALMGASGSGHFVAQRHSAYPPEAHEVWRAVQARNSALIAEYGHKMHPAYIKGMRELQLPSCVPRIEQLNQQLQRTGWRTVCVDGYIPSEVYARLISECIFPISRMVRRPEHIDFAPDPDLIHDVFGHLPMLFSPEYRAYLKRFGEVMSRAESNAYDVLYFSTVRRLAALESDPSSPASEIEKLRARMLEILQAMAVDGSELTHLRRLYVWSIEFGIMGAAGDFAIHGAAFLSAPAEFRALCAAGDACLEPYGLSSIDNENAFTELLHRYFVARDFEHLDEVLSAYERRMCRAASPTRPSGFREIVPTLEGCAAST